MNETLIIQKVENAQARVKQILGQTKNPQAASLVDHTYDDKYLLAEFICNMAISSHLTCLSHLGMTSEHLKTLKAWADSGKTVSLRFTSEEKCSFVRSATREVESATKNVTESSIFGSMTSKTVTTVKEYFWKVEVSWEILAFHGVGDAGSTVRLSGRKGEHVKKTTSELSPHPSVSTPAFTIEAEITWFLKNAQEKESASEAGPSFSPCFSIDRTHVKCATPKRNQDIILASSCIENMKRFYSQIPNFLTHHIYRKLDSNTSNKYSIDSANDENSLFVPVLPLFNQSGGATAAFDNIPITSSSDSLSAAETGENKTETSIVIAFDKKDNSKVILDLSSIHKFLNEENRLLKVKLQDLEQEFPSSTNTELFSSMEAGTLMLAGHMQRVFLSWNSSIDYIESMLRSQLIAAIGQEVTPADFDNYMTFHNNKFFNDEFKPKPMVYSVRRSTNHSPEGTISIERMSSGSVSSTESNANKPIETFCASKGDASSSMGFSISAATRITFSGERYLHGWLRHNFSGGGSGEDKISLNARARQFSGFVVIVGRVLDADNIDPQHAFLVQNRDEIEVPLSLSTIPTAKEFKDSIQSLSPEQKRFAEAFRSMQLGATLMGVLVVQVKPQLEAVLNLPEDSLTKEIKLTKDLFSLFVDYQIPSDLLKFSGEDETIAITDKVAAVKGHVSAMMEMLNGFKEEEIQASVQQLHFHQPSTTLQPADPFSDQLLQMSAPMSRGIDSFDSFGGGGVDRMPQRNMMRSAAPMPKMAMRSRQSAPPPPTPPSAPGGPPPPPVLPSSSISSSSNAKSSSTPAKAAVEPSQATFSQGASSKFSGFDFTAVPADIDSRALELDQGIRPTILKPGDSWMKKAGAALVAKKQTTSTKTLGSEEQREEKDKAFDLLDALTRSGSFPLSHATLHVIVCATVSFDDSVIDTLVLRNVNPIERAERSSMLMAGAVHGVDRHDSSQLVQSGQLDRVAKLSPAMFQQLEN